MKYKPLHFLFFFGGATWALGGVVFLYTSIHSLIYVRYHRPEPVLPPKVIEVTREIKSAPAECVELIDLSPECRPAATSTPAS